MLSNTFKHEQARKRTLLGFFNVFSHHARRRLQMSGRHAPAGPLIVLLHQMNCVYADFVEIEGVCFFVRELALFRNDFRLSTQQFPRTLWGAAQNNVVYNEFAPSKILYNVPPDLYWNALATLGLASKVGFDRLLALVLQAVKRAPHRADMPRNVELRFDLRSTSNR